MQKVIYWCVGLSVVCLFLIGALPIIAGSKWITEPIVKRLARDRFVLTIDSVRLRWFSPLEFQGITMRQDGDVPLLKIHSIVAHRGLFGYLTGGRRLGKITINQPSIDVELLADGSNLTKFIHALQGPEADTVADSKTKPQFDVDVSVRGLSAKVQQQASSSPLVVVPPFDLDLSYEATSGSAKLRVLPTKILREVELSQELLQLGLGYAIPVLAKSAWFDGKVSLDIGELTIDLDEPARSIGDMRVTLHQVRSGPADPQIIQLLELLARIRGREPLQEIVFMDGSQIEVKVADQRVIHTGLQFGLPKVDPRLQLSSSGSVGLNDRSLDLKLKIPVPIENVARRDSVKALGIPTIELPVAGTLDNPKLDWQALRGDAGLILGTIQTELVEEAPAAAAVVGALEGLASGDADEVINAATDIAKELLERRRANQEAAASGESPTSSNAPIRDALKGIFRNRTQPPSR